MIRYYYCYFLQKWGNTMRLRNVKGSQDKIEENPYTIQADNVCSSDYKGNWKKSVFHNNNPIHIEIGMGKGLFITTLAMQNPDINYIGIEKYSSVLVRAFDKREMLETDNLIFMRLDAENITDFFADGEVSLIYLNFSDPWPKDRHAKRRLTSHQFLSRYNKILDSDGYIQFKTDNRELFDFSINEILRAGWTLKDVNYNLHKDGPAPDNVMTEYEKKFYNIGTPILKLTAIRQNDGRMEEYLMNKTFIFLAEGYEEVEMLTVVDMLRRAGISINMVSITGCMDVTSSHNVTIEADMLFEDADFETADMLILPGGVPGTPNLLAFKPLTDKLVEFNNKGKYLAAVCAAPSILGELGILKGKKATCYPGYEEKLTGAEYVKQPVVTDGNVITSRGMGTCIEFSGAIITALAGSDKADEIKTKIIYNDNYNN